MIDAATEIVEIETELAEDIDELRPREPLEFAASFDAEFFQFSLTLLTDSPDFADRQILHELGHLFRFHFKLPIWLVYFAGDFGDQFVGANACGGRQLCFSKNRAPDFLRQRSGRARVRADVEVSFIERERFDYGSELIKYSADDCSFTSINIETRRQHDQIRAALQRHESWHRRAHTELARLVIAGRQNAAPITSAAYPNRFAAQRGAITHFDSSIKAIHVEMDDGARLLLALHAEISHNARRRPSGTFSLRSQISGFANRASL